ncbi:TraR/DksA C4-type zinc finger protein [Paenibacillus sp. CMAA1364]
MTPTLTLTQIKHLQTQLELEQEDIIQRTKDNDHHGLDESFRFSTGELSSIDNHPADVATDLYYRSMDISLVEHDEMQLERIESALEQISKGTYGSCHVCHKAIPYDRLIAIPATSYCKEHSDRQTVSNNRPVEEEFLMPPFGRTSLDERDNQNGFDGEDTWQIVESWGTSNSPAMAEDHQIESYDDMAIEADNEIEGCVEAIESFIAADIEGKPIGIIRNSHYQQYMDTGEGIDTFSALD